jgi:hypothetical protein
VSVLKTPSRSIQPRPLMHSLNRGPSASHSVKALGIL